MKIKSARFKKSEMYTISVKFPNNCTYEEREHVLKCAIIRENCKYDKLPFHYIITEKDMKSAKVNIFVKKKK